VVSRRGDVLFSYERDFESLMAIDLTGAQLAGVVCQELVRMDAKLVGADLRGADLTAGPLSARSVASAFPPPASEKPTGGYEGQTDGRP
jgi:uncharacterized protein YjbI with pentapeptide repeats